MSEQSSAYYEALVDKNTFATSWELVPGRGAVERYQEEFMRSAKEAAEAGKIHALTITDNPGGNPATSAEMLSAELSGLGNEIVVHFTCKDKSRNQLEALLYGLERASVRNVMALTGDHASAGYLGHSTPVFDLDATQLVGLITQLNKGLEFPGPRRTVKLAPTNFIVGAVVSPFKATEAELAGQYYKLKKKLEAGAQFIVTQLGFDARKFHEAVLMMKHLGYEDVPLVGNVYVLSRGAARVMRQGDVPGCVVTDRFYELLTQEAKEADKGKAKRLERAAKMVAMMKGMGYAGVHIGGHGLKYQEVETIIEMGEDLAPQWRDFVHEFDFPQPGGWYYFEKDPETGLNTDTPVDRSQRPPTPLAYRGFRLLHHTIFEPKGILFGPMRAMSEAIDGSGIEDAFNRLEHLGKVITNECMHCGDCGLPDVAYLCPMSQCPKKQRNGPCGGSSEGWCEVYPGKRKCIYVRAYQRLKHYGEADQLGAYLVPPPDHSLRRTSSWLNYFMGRDHTAKRLGLEPPEQEES